MNEELIQEKQTSDEKRLKAIEYFRNMSEKEKQLLREYMNEHFNEFQIDTIGTLLNGFVKVDTIIRAERAEELSALKQQKQELLERKIYEERKYTNFNKTF